MSGFVKVFIVFFLVTLALTSAFGYTRTVLLEGFTSNTSPECATMHRWMDPSLVRQGTTTIAPVFYHMYWPRPTADKWYEADSVELLDRKEAFEITTLPNIYIDGAYFAVTPTTVDSVRLRTTINTRRSINSRVWLKVLPSVTANGDTVLVTVKAVTDSAFNGVTSFTKLRIALVQPYENWPLPRAGTNGQQVFYYPLLSFSNGTQGGPIGQTFTASGRTADTLTFNARFKIRHAGTAPFSALNSSVVAWVQKDSGNYKPRGVYQTAYRRVTYFSSPLATDVFTIGDSATATWDTTVFRGNATLLLNRNYPTGTWDTVRTDFPNTGRVRWLVAGPATTAARLKITNGTDYDISPDQFTITGFTTITLEPNTVAHSIDTTSTWSTNITVRNTGSVPYFSSIETNLGANFFRADTQAGQWFVADTGMTIPGSTGDNVNFGPFPLSFSFPFFGNYYDQVTMNTNGFLSFNTVVASISGSHSTLPSPLAPTIIAPFWDDLIIANNRGRMYYMMDDINGVVAFAWDSVSRVGDPSTRVSFEAILHIDGTIEFIYGPMSGTLNHATIGVQSSLTEATLLAYNTPVTPNTNIFLSPRYRWGTFPTDRIILQPGTSQVVELGLSSLTIKRDSILTGNVRFGGNLSTTAVLPVNMHVVMDVPEQQRVTLPQSITLSAPYPNPFNPTTTIQFSLPTALPVTMQLYDVTGRQVASIFSGKMSAGLHTQVINGDRLATGTYFLKFSAGEKFSTVRKIVLLK